MRIKIFQIDHDKDTKGVKFMPLECACEQGGIDPSIYKTVFYGDVEAENLEDIFRIFNTETLGTHQGHSLSVSDIVEVLGDAPEQSVENGCYFCDLAGFEKVDFDPAQCAEMDGTKVLFVTPHHTPVEIKIGNDLKSMQRAVGGKIEFVCPFDNDDAVLVCNEEGKLIGMEGNRRIEGDVIAGPFFIIRDDGESETTDLTDEQLQKYAERFAQPEDISKEEVEENTGFTFISI
ncbi:MAG: DUF3846 domain-containing protein [Eubacteriales bacterium]|nr:DUF3846 domain-containing protein [Eubacteriales bacterium]